MRVLLVYSNRTRILEPAVPIGLSYVASATRAAGHAVRFLDLMVCRRPLDRLRDELRAFNPDVVGFSVRNIDNIVPQRLAWHLGEVGQMIAVVRAESRAPIVLGGPAASILGPRALQQLDADFVVVGEGEESFPQLLEALAGKGDLATVSGLCRRENGRIVTAPPRLRRHFGSSGMEDWIDWRAYERAGGTWALHTKRGCPLSCLYCNYPVMEGHGLRQRDAADVVEEIVRVQRRVNPRTFEFTDSTFNIPESHALAICEEILRRGLRVNLSAVGINPLGVSPALFPLMKRAGFHSMVITPDAASDPMLRNLDKGFTAEHVLRTAQLARASGIRCAWFFLLGGPGETRETAEETISFCETHLNWRGCSTIILTGVRVLPGTRLASQSLERGELTPDRDLCEPVFYFSPLVDEAWVLERINQAIRRCPSIAHGAEENGSWFERVFNHTLYWLGAAPPYWRFLGEFLRIPPLPALRARSTGVRVAKAADHPGALFLANTPANGTEKAPSANVPTTRPPVTG